MPRGKDRKLMRLSDSESRLSKMSVVSVKRPKLPRKFGKKPKQTL